MTLSEQFFTKNKYELLLFALVQHLFVGICISDQVLELFPTLPYSSVTARYKALLEKGYIKIDGTRIGRSGRQQRIMKCQ